jgi:glycosyltransferase involved in cell wall biosynthesis
MNVVYTAPNRAHHYRYALALHKAGMLRAFISGFSRLSPRARIDTLKREIHRADLLQTVYIASLKVGMPATASAYLAYWSKIEQDYACQQFIDGSDVFVFYNGSGLHTCQYARQKGVITVVEAVNSHIDYQEQIMEEEHRRQHLPWRPSLKKEKERRIEEYHQADYILTPSEFVKKSFLAFGFPERKLLKVPFGFDRLPVNTVKNNPKNFTILYVGSISVRKGVRYLIEAFGKVQHPHKKLVIVGPRTDPDGLHGVSIPANVVFTGSLKGDELAQAYQAADVFCLPSLEEGLALVLGEALSYGLPIVTTTNSGGDDLLTDGREGFIVPIRDAEKLHEKLQLLADDDDLRQTMKLAAQARSQHIEGWQATGELLTSTLGSLLPTR